MNELYNPYDDELYDDEGEEGLALVEVAEKPKKRRRKNPEPIAMATPILLVAVGYLGWCLYNQTKYKVWNWQPWKLAGRPRLQLRRANPQTEAEKQRQAEFDRAIEQSLKPSVITVDTDIPWKKPTIKPSDEEVVSFIYP